MELPSCKILLADDHRVLIEGIKSVLKEYGGYQVVGEAVNGQEAVELAARHRPDIVVMDISMPGMDGIEATQRIKCAWPDTKVVVYTMHSDQAFINELCQAGISGYVLKGGAVTDLISALGAVQEGRSFFTSTAPRNLLGEARAQAAPQADHLSLDSLSSREMEVFKLLADGLSIKGIAEKLFISPKTVETHKYKIMTKLNVKTIPELTKLAIKHRLIQV